MPIGNVGDICGADFAGSNDSMEMYPAILLHILVEIWGKNIREDPLNDKCCSNHSVTNMKF